MALSRPALGDLARIDQVSHPDLKHEDDRMSDDDLRAELERLRQENETLKKGASRGVSLKVSEKGGLSVYGLGRFPVTLYKEQWVKLLDIADDIRAFLKENDSRLKSKEGRPASPFPRSSTARPGRRTARRPWSASPWRRAFAAST